MKTQKELKEVYQTFLSSKIYPHDKSMVDYELKNTRYLVELSEGSLIRLEKPRIKKMFCYPDHWEDADETAYKVRTDPEYFISENLADLRRDQEKFSEDAHYGLWLEPSYDKEGCGLLKYCTTANWRDDAYDNPLTREDRSRIFEGYQNLMRDFEKRLRSYVKRYGLKSVYSWTYWADR